MIDTTDFFGEQIAPGDVVLAPVLASILERTIVLYEVLSITKGGNAKVIKHVRTPRAKPKYVSCNMLVKLTPEQVTWATLRRPSTS